MIFRFSNLAWQKEANNQELEDRKAKRTLQLWRKRLL